MKKFTLAISRAYGSGGRIVGQHLAARLGIPCYDKLIIEETAQKSGLSKDYINRLEEHITSSFLFNLASASVITPMGYVGYDVPVSYKAFSVQSEVIRELAGKTACVVIGRCSEYILKDEENCVKVFIYADRADRIKRISGEYGLTEQEADARLTKTDKARANYYKTFTGETWGSPYDHDLCINTSKVGTAGAVDVITEYLKKAGLL